MDDATAEGIKMAVEASAYIQISSRKRSLVQINFTDT